MKHLFIILATAAALTLSACSESEPEPTETTEAPTSVESADIQVTDLSAEGTRFASAEFPVSDAFTHDGTIRNLKEGCVSALQAAKDETENWWDYDIIQCMGLADWSDAVVTVGSANFSGAVLSEISEADMESDPEALWDRAEQSNISPELQD